MSYILEAMRKAERDTTMGQSVNLPPASATRSRKLLYPLLALVLLVLTGAGIWVGTHWVNPFPDQAEQAVTKAVTTPTAAVQVSTQPSPITPVLTMAVTIEPVPDIEPPATVTNSPRVRTATAADWRELPDSAQLIDQLPENLQQLQFGIHVFDKTPSRRFLLINGRRYQEGDKLFGTARISEITPDGIAIKYGNLHFHKAR